MADQYTQFEIRSDLENVLWKGHVTPENLNLVQNYSTAGDVKEQVVIHISDNDYLWHAQIPGKKPIKGSYDDVTTFLASEGIDVPGKEEIIENIYGLAPRAQFVCEVLLDLKTGSSEFPMPEEATDVSHGGWESIRESCVFGEGE